MRQESSTEIAKLITTLVASSSLAERFKSVDVDTGHYDENQEFLRIVLHFKYLQSFSDDDVDRVTSYIEDAVAERDDRLASVRFSEP